MTQPACLLAVDVNTITVQHCSGLSRLLDIDWNILQSRGIAQGSDAGVYYSVACCAALDTDGNMVWCCTGPVPVYYYMF